MDVRKADLNRHRELLGWIPQEEGIKGKTMQENWLFFKEAMRAQEQAIPVRRMRKHSKKPAWLNHKPFNYMNLGKKS